MDGIRSLPAAASTCLRIYLFGRLRVESPTGPIHLPAKVASLLAYLVLHPELHAREKLAALFWGDVPDDQARHSLRTALNCLRRVIGDQLLLGDRDSIQLDPSFPLWVDVREFERQVGPGAEAPLADLTFVQLYQGDLLSDFYDEWIFSERERYCRQYQETLLQATQRVRSQSEFRQAIGLALQVLAQDPANERAHQHLIFCYAASGDRSAALRQYEACCRALRNQLDVPPSSQTDALYRWVREAQAQTRMREALITNLPFPLTDFIGRKEEIAQIKALLTNGGRACPGDTPDIQGGFASEQGLRLLTLTGAGGSGKTRLAIEVGLDLVESYRDGVWWVDLAPVTDDGLVHQTVARALGVPERPNAPIMDTLVEHLRSKEMLLLLDNCEHLTKACAPLAAALLASCSGLEIMATSRASLGIAGERVWQVPTLAVPDPNEVTSVAALRQLDAVALFLNRAAASSPGFVLTTTNATDVAQVCAQLDGLPLAIELAAGRMKVLTVQQIAARLADRFSLCTGGSLVALPRHRTLRATIDWSCDLLSEPERALFQRLSAFVGGWTLEAAEAVCSGDGLQTHEVLNLLTQLVDKSLVIMTAQGTAARYRLLETLRQYSAESLATSGMSGQISHRHALYYASFAERAAHELRSPAMGIWLERLETEHDNFRAALSWSLEHEPPETCLRFAGALGIFWSKRGYLREGRSWLDRLLACSTDAPPLQRVMALAPAGWFARALGEYERAIALNEAALDLCRQAGASVWKADILNQRGVVAIFGGDYDRARACLGESLALAEELGERWARAVPLVYLAHTALFDLAWDARAKARCGEGLALCREMDDQSEAAHAHIILGLGAHFEGDDESARGHFAEGVTLCRQGGDPRQLAYAMGLLGLALHWLERWAEGLPLAVEGLRTALRLGEKTAAANMIQFLALLAKDQGQLTRAVRLMSFTYGWGESFGFRLAPMMRAINDPELAALRAALGSDVFAQAWAEGREMMPEEAFAIALDAGE